MPEPAENPSGEYLLDPTKRSRTNPTLCLECGQSFIGTSSCPFCSKDSQSLLPEIVLPDAKEELEIVLPESREEPEILLSDQTDEPRPRREKQEEQAQRPDSKELLKEMADIGFTISDFSEK